LLKTNFTVVVQEKLVRCLHFLNMKSRQVKI